MSKITSGLLLLIGLIVIFYGTNVSFGHASHWPSLSDWAHPDRSRWLLIAGLFVGILGVVGLLRSPKAL